jgi:hypothetical protein
MKPYLKVTIGYLAFGLIWIIFSDRLLKGLAADIHNLTLFQTVKGCVYVLLSTLLIYFLTKRAFEGQIAQEKEKLVIFKKTVSGVHHILLNYLNQMQLVTMEAERCADFDPETVALSKKISDHAAKELVKLSEIEVVDSEHIDSVVFRDSRRER